MAARLGGQVLQPEAPKLRVHPCQLGGAQRFIQGLWERLWLEHNPRVSWGWLLGDGVSGLNATEGFSWDLEGAGLTPQRLGQLALAGTDPSMDFRVVISQHVKIQNSQFNWDLR